MPDGSGRIDPAVLVGDPGRRCGDGRVVGGGGIAPLAGGDPDVCELRKMYFLPSLRGLGAGMALGLYETAFSTLAHLYGARARLPITGITLMAGFASTVGWPLTAALERSVKAVQGNSLSLVSGAGHDGVAEPDIELHRAAGTVQQAQQRHTDTRVVCVLADLGHLHGLGLEDDAVFDLDLANLAE